MDMANLFFFMLSLINLVSEVASGGYATEFKLRLREENMVCDINSKPAQGPRFSPQSPVPTFREKKQN